MPRNRPTFTIVTLTVTIAAVTLAAGCRRTPGGAAAEHAQEACIVALEPVARHGRYNVEALQTAAAEAEEAVDGDDRWGFLPPVLADVRAAVSAGDSGGGRAGTALEEACRRVNDIVKAVRAGQDPPA